jgi:hypothetical protein
MQQTDDRFERIARSHGWGWVGNAMPWAEGPGIVHLGTWKGTVLLSDSVYETWDACCEETT